MLNWLNGKKIMTLVALTLAALLLVIATCDYLIRHQAKPYIYTDTSHMPVNDVGVVLGTSRYTSKGNLNGHYWRRLEAVAELVDAKRIQYVLVSGDNGTRWYDEPTRMKQDLMTLGVPGNIIYRDYAGFRTLDSVLRARDVFGLDSFTIISQQFQNERALYIARHNGINAVAFNARGSLIPSDYSNRTREILARVLAVLETHLLGTGPRVLGPAIVIGETPPT